MTSDIVKRASEFASKAHNGQVRKYTGEPYFGHPVEVMEIVSEVIDDPEVHAAALLHDVVEDTPRKRRAWKTTGSQWGILRICSLKST